MNKQSLAFESAAQYGHLHDIYSALNLPQDEYYKIAINNLAEDEITFLYVEALEEIELEENFGKPRENPDPRQGYIY